MKNLLNLPFIMLLLISDVYMKTLIVNDFSQ